jgi:hypothetical protein
MLISFGLVFTLSPFFLPDSFISYLALYENSPECPLNQTSLLNQVDAFKLIMLQLAVLCLAEPFAAYKFKQYHTAIILSLGMLPLICIAFLY